MLYKKMKRICYDYKKIYIRKKHNCSYISHSYNNSNNNDQIFNDINLNIQIWNNIDFRMGYINWYLKNIKLNEELCYEFIKGKISNKTNEAMINSLFLIINKEMAISFIFWRYYISL